MPNLIAGFQMGCFQMMKVQGHITCQSRYLYKHQILLHFAFFMRNGTAHVTVCLKVCRVGQVKSTGNHGRADTRSQSYFQVMKAIVRYNVWAWFSTSNKTVLGLGLRHNSKIWGEASDWLRGRSSQLGGRKTSFASIQTVEGSNSYSELKCLKVRGGRCNLDK